MKHLVLASLAALALNAPLCTAGASAPDREPDGKPREVVVGCSSTVAYDPGGCQRPARRKCSGAAEFVAVLASTPLAGSGLHSISARYRCLK